MSIAVDAAGRLEKEGFKVRIVSLPCWLVFDSQPEEYRLEVLRSGAPILSLEVYTVGGFSLTGYRGFINNSSFIKALGWQKYSHEVGSLRFDGQAKFTDSR